MYVYDLIAIIIIATSHVYLFLNLIKYKQISWKLLTTISVIFTILLMIIVTATGFPEFNALLLLIFFTITRFITTKTRFNIYRKLILCLI